MPSSEGTAERTAGGVGKWIDVADHPILYMIAVTLFVVAFMNLFYYAFVQLGWNGPASLFK
jgi:hypothetical protein